ncbi:MAG: transglutaminase domain-containing protein [Fidelibacterota bacterium]|nr:MAG: transglutaminase domain-containing protein [Candidatus Neomarinimicrobiota bacterium]
MNYREFFKATLLLIILLLSADTTPAKLPSILGTAAPPVIPDATDQQQPPKSKERVRSDLRYHYWNYYQPQDELTIQSIEDLPSENIKIKLNLQPHWPNFSHFLISVEDAEFEISVDGSVMAEFSLDDISAAQTTTVVKMVSESGTVSQPYTITIISNPNKYWASRGAAGYPNWITIKTDPYLNFTPDYAIDNWIYKRPTSEERKFAKQKWGSLIQGAKTNHDRAKLLAKSLMDDLKPHIGVPSDAMKVPPFQQYERMVSGQDRGFCTNLAAIFIHACNSFGIPARRIHLEKVPYQSDKFSVRMGGMHSTTEIFDDQLNQWVWIDLTYNVLAAYLGDEGPLNAAEFSLFLNNPQRRNSLRVVYYRHESQLEALIPLDRCPEKFASLDGRDTELHYFYAPKGE